MAKDVKDRCPKKYFAFDVMPYGDCDRCEAGFLYQRCSNPSCERFACDGWAKEVAHHEQVVCCRCYDGLVDPVYTYKGILTLYYETGMEGIWAGILADDRGWSKGPCFNNETKQYDGPEQDYHDLNWSHWFKKHGDHLTVYNEDGTVKWSGDIVIDRKATIEKRFQLIPKGIDPAEWISWFQKELRAEVRTKKRMTGDKLPDTFPKKT